MSSDVLLAIILIPVLSGACAFLAIYFTNKKNTPQAQGVDQSPAIAANSEEATALKAEAAKEIENAKVRGSQIVIDAKEEAIRIKQKAENEISDSRRKFAELERKIDKRQEDITTLQQKLEVEIKGTNDLKAIWDEKIKEVENLRQEQISKLEKVAAMTKEEGKKLILDNLEKSLDNEMAKKIKEAEEKFQLEADAKGKEILLDAMHTAANDYVAEYTISKIKLADPDLKGKIIGKDGRNIKAFEDATGVNVDFDESEIRLSSFDSVRREIARISLERLIKDGRIHPARIEEVIEKTSSEMDKVILQAGEDLCASVGVYNLPKELTSKLGAFKYRTSYGQNMIMHTLEETKIGVRIAKELGADVVTTKLACLLHDIGKVITDKEGNHIELGAEYLKKFNLPEGVIKAVAEHHDDKPSTLAGVIVQIADSISGSRPGARYEDYESYVKRMRSLEEAATGYEGVDKAFAISAGRELRVIVKPDDINDVQAVKLSHDIAEKIQKEQTYPGTVKVIVIRELRTTATAT